ncbi:MAG: hypothetical protein AAF389_02830 [Gemmatimonadota bacterium]
MSATSLALLIHAPLAAQTDASAEEVLRLRGLPALTSLAVESEGHELRIWTTGQGMVNSFFRAWEDDGVEGEEFALWWTTLGQPWTADSEAASLEALFGQARWAGECAVKQIPAATYRVVRDGQESPARPWVTVCTLQEAIPVEWLSETADELADLPLETLGSNGIEWTDHSGTAFRTRDGGSVRGDLVVDGAAHHFRWTAPESRSEPGAETAAAIADMMHSLREHVLDEVVERAERLGASR